MYRAGWAPPCLSPSERCVVGWCVPYARVLLLPCTAITGDLRFGFYDQPITKVLYCGKMKGIFFFVKGHTKPAADLRSAAADLSSGQCHAVTLYIGRQTHSWQHGVPYRWLRKKKKKNLIKKK